MRLAGRNIWLIYQIKSIVFHVSDERKDIKIFHINIINYIMY